MIRTETHLGTIEISYNFFSTLVGRAASECFGVVGMVASSPEQGLARLLKKQEAPDTGVRVRNSMGKLTIDLHIAVSYGVNISAIVKSIIHKVRYTVEEATGLEVSKVNVYIDDMKAIQ